MKSLKKKSKWFGFCYRNFKEDGSYDLVLQVKECFENPLGKIQLPLRMACSSIFIVDIDTGIIAKDRSKKRIGKKATALECEIFEAIKKTHEYCKGAGI